MLARPFGGHYSGTRDGISKSAYQVGYGITGNNGETTGGGQYKYSYGNSYEAHPGTTPTGPTAIFYTTVGLTPTSESEDMMMGVLGPNWNLLRAGDKVNIKIIHTPTGKTLVDKDISVEG